MGGDFGTSRSMSGIQPTTSSHQNGPLRFDSDMDLYTLTGTPASSENSIYGNATQHGSSVFGNNNDKTRNRHGHCAYYDWPTNHHGTRNDRIPTITSSAHGYTPTVTPSSRTTTNASARASTPISNRNKSRDDLYTSTLALFVDEDDEPDELIKNCLSRTTTTPTTSNYIPSTQTISNYGPPMPTNSNYGPPMPTNSNYIPPMPTNSNYIPSIQTTSSYRPSTPTTSNYVPPMSTNSNYIPSTQTTSNYIPSTPTTSNHIYSAPATGNYIPSTINTSNYIPSTSTTNDNFPTYSQKDTRPNQTTTKATPLNQQEPNYAAIESYIYRMDRKNSSRQSKQTTHTSPATPVLLPCSDIWDAFDIPKTTTTTTTNTSTTIRQSQTPSISCSDNMCVLGNGRTTQSRTMATWATLIYGSDNEPIQLHKRAKVDEDFDVEPKKPRRLAMDEAFEFDEPNKITQTTTRKSGYTKKVNGKIGTETNDLLRLLKGITMLDTEQQGNPALDERQELAFFDDEETPKHYKNSRQTSRQSLVNGFDGFSDVEDDGG